MLIQTYTNGEGEPRIRVIEESGMYVISLDVFRRLPSPPPEAEAMDVGRHRVLWRRERLMSGFCEYLYLQTGGEVQLINIKYVGPDNPQRVIEVLLQLENGIDK